MQTRRSFLKKFTAGSLLLGTGQFPFPALAAGSVQQLCILHTNDTHSRLDPFPADSGPMAGAGGVRARAVLVNAIRRTDTQVILVDAGDFLQGTSWYELHKGIPEVEAMSLMQYDAVALGEHDLYGGIDELAASFKTARFPVVCSNYLFTGTALEQIVVPHKILFRNGMKIGIMAIAPSLYGSVPDHVAAAIGYKDPMTTALETSERLKHKERCDMIICLSRLGLPDHPDNRPDDRKLAAESFYIDVIIGGRTHTLLQQPLIIRNKKKNEVLVSQMGWGGVNLGRLNYIFSDKKKILSVNAQTVILGK